MTKFRDRVQQRNRKKNSEALNARYGTVPSLNKKMQMALEMLQERSACETRVFPGTNRFKKRIHCPGEIAEAYALPRRIDMSSGAMVATEAIMPWETVPLVLDCSAFGSVKDKIR